MADHDKPKGNDDAGEEEEARARGFRVVDRRRTQQESPPAVPDAAPVAVESPAPPEAVAAASEPAAPPPASSPRLAPLDFSTLVLSMATQGLAYLGLAAPEGEEAMAPDLVAASHMVDSLEVLREKTRGNLTAEEDRLLRQLLLELRLHYVQATRRAGA